MEWINYVYPILSICGLFGIILALGIGFAYLWLLYLGKKASKCPECERKGAGKLLESEVIHSKINAILPQRGQLGYLDCHYA